MPTLKPNIYRDLKYTAQGGNKISTVNTRLMSNRVQTKQTIHAEEVTSAEYNGVKYALPISNAIKSQYIRAITNYGPYDETYDTYWAKARVECLMASGSTLCYTDKPLVGEPSVDIQLEGVSYVIDKGDLGYDGYPSEDTLKDFSYNASSWLQYAGQSRENAGLIKHYDGISVGVNPWIKRVVEAPTETTTDDVFASWAAADKHGAEANGWTEICNFNPATYPLVEMLPPGATDNYKKIIMRNVQLPIRKDIIKVSDYVYQVEWTLPIRFNFIASSRVMKKIAIGHAYDELDGYAFSDRVTKIIITLSGQPLNQEYVERSYSNDVNGNIVEQSKNDNLFSITNGSTLFTLDTYAHWTRKNVFDSESTDFTANARINEDGTVSTFSGTNLTGYIFVPAFRQIVAPNYSGGTIQGARYDKALGFVSALNVKSDSAYTNRWSEDCYVRFNYIPQDDYKVELVYPLPWSEELSARLLSKYAEGKYICECKVPAEWAVKNNVHIGTRMNIILPGGKYISRSGATCTFTVKNITKDFNSRVFDYTLHMQEV